MQFFRPCLYFSCNSRSPRLRMFSGGSFETCHSHRLPSLVSFVSSGFDKERRKDLATGRANTQSVNLQQKPNRVEAVSSCDISKDSAHNLLFCQQSCDGSLCPPWRMCPLTIAITPLLLLWPSVCVMSKRPYQRRWCHSTKCTLPLSVSEDFGNSIKNTCQTSPRWVVLLVFCVAAAMIVFQFRCQRQVGVSRATIFSQTGAWSPVWGHHTQYVMTAAAKNNQWGK